jgi:uncharacterized protein YpiB (UPF0302 family)
MKMTIYDNDDYTLNMDMNPDYTTPDTIRTNLKNIHTTAVQRHMSEITRNKVLGVVPLSIDKSEETLYIFRVHCERL